MNKKIIIGICILLIMVFGISALEITITNISLENKNALLRVGLGIGSVTKTKEICTYDSKTLEENCFNETYTDTLKRLEQGCDGSYCYFKLFEDGGINKEFKVKLDMICSNYGMCKDLEESYECCLTWREETEEEILEKANIKSEEILNHIAGVTLEREARVKEKRFEDIELII